VIATVLPSISRRLTAGGQVAAISTSRLPQALVDRWFRRT